MHAPQARTVALGILFLWFLVGGLAHFVATDLFLQIVPPWVPEPRATVLVSGAFELLGAIGLLWLRTRRIAGWGLFALTLAVTPANIYMLQNAERWPLLPEWLLIARLPLQLVLLGLIVWSIRPARSARG